MKKFLSLVLALAMILSCVSMVSFVANAEEATETPKGVRFTSLKDLTSDDYFISKRTQLSGKDNALFTAEDVVLDEATRVEEGDVRCTGIVSLKYVVYNEGPEKVTFEIQFQGGNAHGDNNTGWSGIGGTNFKVSDLAVGGHSIAKMSFPVYELADGGYAVKSSGSKYTRSDDEVFSDGTAVLAGYAPLWTAALRIQFTSDTTTAGKNVLVITDKADDPIYQLKATTAIGAEKIYEKPYHTLSTNGDVEKGTAEGWRTFSSGNLSAIDENEIDKTKPEGENHIIKFVPSGIYHSASFNFAPYIIQDEDYLLNGNGAGRYVVSFDIKAEAGKSGSFGASITTPTYSGATQAGGSPLIEVTDQWQRLYYVVDISQSFLDNLDAQREKAGDTTGAGNYSNLIMRLDGNGKWTENTLFTYYMDNLKIEYYSGPTAISLTKANAADVNAYLTRKGMFTEEMIVNGSLNTSYTIYNTNDYDITVTLYHQNGWSDGDVGKVYNIQKKIPAHTKTVYNFSIPAKTAEDGTIKVGSNYETALEELTLRVNMYGADKVPQNAKFILEDNSDFDVVLKYLDEGNNLGNVQYTLGKLYSYEIPDYDFPTPYTLVNGDVSKGDVGDTTIEGWSIFSGGTNTIDVDPEDKNNKVVRFDPSGEYASTGFRLTPAIYNDNYLYMGNGVGLYKITFRARLVDAIPEGADAKKAGHFNVQISGTTTSGKTYYTGGKGIDMTDKWQTFTAYLTVEQSNYTTWTETTADAKNNNVVLRLDGSSATGALKYTGKFVAVPYLIDDVDISYMGIPNGYEFTSTSSYMSSSTGVFSKADVKGGYITSSHTFYNPMDKEISIEYGFQGTVKSINNSKDENGKWKAEVPLDENGNPTDYLNGWHGPMQSVIIQPGQKVTLTVKVPANAETGKATILSSAIPAVEGISEKGRQDVDITSLFIRVNATSGTKFIIETPQSDAVISTIKTWGIVYYGITPDFKIAGANLELGESLVMNFYAKLGEDYENATMNIVRNGKTASLKGTLVTEGTYAGLYQFVYTDLNPQCMNDNIEAHIMLDGASIFHQKTYSVKQYASNLYNSTADALGYSDAKFAALKSLLGAMLNYGTEAQSYTKYNTENLVNADLDWAQNLAFDEPETDDRVVINDDPAAKVRSVGLNISNVYKIFFRLEITDSTGVTIYLQKGDGVAVDVTEDIEDNKIYTDAIKATEAEDDFTLTIKRGENVVSKVTYDVNDYIVKMNGSGEGSAITKAISTYSQAADAFVAIAQ